MKIPKGAPPTAPLGEIAKSGTERLCAPMSSIILQSFNLVGHEIREKIEENRIVNGRMDGRTDGHPTHFIRSFWSDHLIFTYTIHEFDRTSDHSHND